MHTSYSNRCIDVNSPLLEAVSGSASFSFQVLLLAMVEIAVSMRTPGSVTSMLHARNAAETSLFGLYNKEAVTANKGIIEKLLS